MQLCITLYWQNTAQLVDEMNKQPQKSGTSKSRNSRAVATRRTDTERNHSGHYQAKGKESNISERGIGGALRQLRLSRGLNQTELGKRLGVSLQQVQKYESGANRIAASTLYRAAEVLKVDVGALYAGLKTPKAGTRQARDRNASVLIIPVKGRTPPNRAREAELIDVITNYQAIANADERALVRKLLSRLSPSPARAGSS